MSGPPAGVCNNDGRDSRNSYVGVCFDPSGDKLYVQDREADGRSAYGYFNDSRISAEACRNSRGNGNWVVCSYGTQVPEGIAAYFVGYTKDNEGILNPWRNIAPQAVECTGGY